MNSIDQSRRVIVFLTENFIDSHWCIHEFRAAQIESFNERRNRIIIITHGNVEVSEQMDAELRAYLRLHLYIKFEDPRFWEKLLLRNAAWTASDQPLPQLKPRGRISGASTSLTSQNI
jgi:TIR domain